MTGGDLLWRLCRLGLLRVEEGGYFVDGTLTLCFWRTLAERRRRAERARAQLRLIVDKLHPTSPA